jgi:hypothetical protein
MHALWYQEQRLHLGIPHLMPIPRSQNVMVVVLERAPFDFEPCNRRTTYKYKLVFSGKRLGKDLHSRSVTPTMTTGWYPNKTFPRNLVTAEHFNVALTR